MTLSDLAKYSMTRSIAGLSMTAELLVSPGNLCFAFGPFLFLKISVYCWNKIFLLEWDAVPGA